MREKGIKVKRRAGMRIKVDGAKVYGEKEKFQNEKGYGGCELKLRGGMG